MIPKEHKNAAQIIAAAIALVITGLVTYHLGDGAVVDRELANKDERINALEVHNAILQNELTNCQQRAGITLNEDGIGFKLPLGN